MLTKTMKRAAAIILATIAIAVLAGCTQSQTAQTEDTTPAPNEYMTSVAKMSSQLSDSLTDFAAAVSENDVSAVQTKAQAAYDILDQMKAIEAPDDLKSVKGKYDEASQSLKNALKDYTAIYLEIENAPEGQAYDFSNYTQQLEAVQKEYDEGLNQLEEADKMASEM